MIAVTPGGISANTAIRASPARYWQQGSHLCTPGPYAAGAGAGLVLMLAQVLEQKLTRIWRKLWRKLWPETVVAASVACAAESIPAGFQLPGYGLSYYNNKNITARHLTVISRADPGADSRAGPILAGSRSVHAAADGPGRAGRPHCRFHPQFRCPEFLQARPQAKPRPKARRIRPAPQTDAHGP